MVGKVRDGLTSLFSLPDGYEVVLGNGGATEFWDIATFGLIRERSQHLSFGEFSSKFASAEGRGTVPRRPDDYQDRSGDHPEAKPESRVDVYALTHNETSTGVAMPIRRVARWRPDSWSTRRPARAESPSTASEFDVYYFAPAEVLRADGGLWIALCSPAALERVAEIDASGRWIPTSYSLTTALENSRPTRPTTRRRVATLFLLADQFDWMLGLGGLTAATARTKDSRSGSTRGPRSRGRHAVRRGPDAPLAGRRHRRLHRRGGRRGRRRCCGRTGSSTPSRTASSGVTSCASGCSPPSSPTTSRR